MRRSDVPPSVSGRFVAFAPRYHRRAQVFAPLDAERGAGGLGGWHPASRSGIPMETTGPPKFLGNPGDRCPCSSTPAGPNAPSGTRCGGVRHGPRLCPRRGLPASLVFGAQSHDLRSRCLRFAGRVASPPRKTRFWLLARLCQAGLVTRRVSTRGFRIRDSSSSPQACLAQGHRKARQAEATALQFLCCRRNVVSWRNLSLLHELQLRATRTLDRSMGLRQGPDRRLLLGRPIWNGLRRERESRKLLSGARVESEVQPDPFRETLSQANAGGGSQRR